MLLSMYAVHCVCMICWICYSSVAAQSTYNMLLIEAKTYWWATYLLLILINRSLLKIHNTTDYVMCEKLCQKLSTSVYTVHKVNIWNHNTWGNPIWYWSGQRLANRIVIQLWHLCVEKDNTYEHFCSAGGWEDKALKYLKLCAEFIFLNVIMEQIYLCIWNTWYDVVLKPGQCTQSITKYPNILNVLMLEGDKVACGNALHTRLVRVHWNVKEQSFIREKHNDSSLLYFICIKTCACDALCKTKTQLWRKHWRISKWIWLQSINLSDSPFQSKAKVIRINSNIKDLSEWHQVQWTLIKWYAQR